MLSLKISEERSQVKAVREMPGKATQNKIATTLMWGLGESEKIFKMPSFKKLFFKQETCRERRKYDLWGWGEAAVIKTLSRPRYCVSRKQDSEQPL